MEKKGSAVTVGDEWIGKFLAWVDGSGEGPSWCHPVTTDLSLGSPAHGDLEPRQGCGIPFLGLSAHLRGPTFPVSGFMS